MCEDENSVSSRSVAMVMSLLGSAAPIAAFWRSPDGGRTGPAPPSAATAAGAQRRTAGGGYFASRCKAGLCPAAENSRRPPLRARAACPSDRPLEGSRRGCFREGSNQGEPTRSTIWRPSVALIIPARPRSSAQESSNVFRGNLDPQGRSKLIDTKTGEVFVEVAQHRGQRERLNPG